MEILQIFFLRDTCHVMSLNTCHEIFRLFVKIAKYQEFLKNFFQECGHKMCLKKLKISDCRTLDKKLDENNLFFVMKKGCLVIQRICFCHWHLVV